MAFFDWGNPPINSTETGLTTNPTTGVVLATISTSYTQAAGGNFFFWITVGASSTGMTFAVETLQNDSTTLSTVNQRKDLYAVPFQSATYPLFTTLERGEHLRVKAGSTMTGTVFAFITGQKQT